MIGTLHLLAERTAEYPRGMKMNMNIAAAIRLFMSSGLDWDTKDSLAGIRSRLKSWVAAVGYVQPGRVHTVRFEVD